MFRPGVEGDAAENRDDREPAEPEPELQSLRTKVELDLRIAVGTEQSGSRPKGGFSLTRHFARDGGLKKTRPTQLLRSYAADLSYPLALDPTRECPCGTSRKACSPGNSARACPPLRSSP